MHADADLAAMFIERIVCCHAAFLTGICVSHSIDCPSRTGSRILLSSFSTYGRVICASFSSPLSQDLSSYDHCAAGAMNVPAPVDKFCHEYASRIIHQQPSHFEPAMFTARCAASKVPCHHVPCFICLRIVKHFLRTRYKCFNVLVSRRASSCCHFTCASEVRVTMWLEEHTRG